MTGAPSLDRPGVDTPSQDGRLVLAFLDGDRSAGEALVHRYHRRLVGAMGHWATSDPDRARELAQEAWLRAFAALDSFDVHAPLWPWLRRIGDNAARSSLRRGLVGQSARQRLVADVPDDAVAVDDGLEQRLEAAAVGAALAQLPQQHREVLELVYVEDVGQSDVALLLGISHGALRVRLLRARAELRRRLDRVLALPAFAPLERWLRGADVLAPAGLALALSALLLPGHVAHPAPAPEPPAQVTTETGLGDTGLVWALVREQVRSVEDLVAPESRPSPPRWAEPTGAGSHDAGPAPDRIPVPEPDELGVPQRHVTLAPTVETPYARTEDDGPPAQYSYEYRVQYVEEYHRLVRHNDDERAAVHDPMCASADGLARVECSSSTE